ncbi:family 16 glycosylhydrolase [Paenibacillus alba]|uniref:family 16 glycosylhydrolase n=1 Tax=Paenibacillus alba TaxID=1197127 RepID=UPI001FEA853B|nr:family 16 glycosylhydrolase [Paenibacillus alba]
MKKHFSSTLLLLLGLSLLPAYSALSAPTDNWQLVWSDEFNGTNGSAPDSTKWSLIDQGGGFGNSELEYYTSRRDNSYQENGSLVIAAKKENYSGQSYTSAKLISKNKGDWKYGRFEIRAKLPQGRGMWPAIWMLSTDAVYGGWPKSGEIDMMENRGDQMDKVSGTIHYGNDWPNNTYSGASYLLPSGQSFADAYHTFAVEWEEGAIRWYVDDVLYSTKTNWFTPSAPYPAPFDQKFYLMLNLAIGGPNTPFTGKTSPDDSALPQKFYIDYVRAYTKAASSTALDRTGWTATTSPVNSTPANMLDGNTNSRWTTGTDMVPGQYFIVDMNASKTFNKLTIDCTGNNNDYARGYQVFVSSDGTNWGSAIASGTGTAPLITVNFASKTARYIKVVQTGTGTNWWSVREFNVYN